MTLPREVLSASGPRVPGAPGAHLQRFLTRISLGILRVLYTPTSREVAVLRRPFVLLRFHPPEYEIRP